MGTLQSGDDSLQPGQFGEGFECLVIGGVGVLDPAEVPQPGVLRSHSGVIQAGTDAVGQLHLAKFILQQVGAGALKNSEGATLEAGSVAPCLNSFPSGLHTDHLDVFIVKERVKEPNGIGSAAHTGYQKIGQAAFLLKNLAAGLVPNNPLKVADHQGIRVCAVGGAENVMGAPDIRDPVPHRLVDRLFQGLLSGFDGYHLSPEHFHPIDVQSLTLAIDGTHIDDAFHAKHGGHSGGGHPMLAGPGLGDDPRLAHAPGQKDLADGIVDLVCPGMEEILPLEVNFGPAEFPCEALGVVEGGGAAAEFPQVVIELPLEFRILPGAVVFLFQLLQRVHQGLGDIAAAKCAKMSQRIRHCFGGNQAHVSEHSC